MDKNNITCPNCSFKFNVEHVLTLELEKKLKEEYSQKLNSDLSELDKERKNLEQQQQLFEEKRKKENEIFSEKLKAEKQKLEAELQEQLRKSISLDFENQLKILQTSDLESQEKLKQARERELIFLKKEKELKTKEEELEISLQKKLQEERNSLSAEIRQHEQEKNKIKDTESQLKIQDLSKQVEDQKKMVDEMKRKAEQGSMQLQGESQEILLEKTLAETFPLDQILEVGKGVEGADCIQIVKNYLGVETGKIIYESKRAKNWKNEWLTKLKADMRNQAADFAILVTQVYPKDMEIFGEKEGIWICTFSEVTSLASILRNGILKIYEAQKSQEGKAEKMQMLYNYLTGVEFRGQIEAIAEGFRAMRNSITTERMQMEKTWKAREKQLEKVLLNTSALYGSVKGIAGASIGEIPLFDDSNEVIAELE